MILFFGIQSILDKESFHDWLNTGPPKEVTIDDESKTDFKMNLNSEKRQHLGIN